MRGSPGYPKGEAYSTVPQGLLLRPAVPTDETFGLDSTYGPKANFKISLRELPDDGRFRITVTAAKYNDGLLLDQGAKPQEPEATGRIEVKDLKAPGNLTVPKPGIYQVDVYSGKPPSLGTPDVSRLNEGLSGSWHLNADAKGAFQLVGKAKFV